MSRNHSPEASRTVGALASLCLSFALTTALAAPNDSELLDAYDAWRSRDLDRLNSYSHNFRPHLLEDYPQYWRLQANLKTADPSAVRQFLQRYGESPLAERLRVDALKQLGRNSDWQNFNAIYVASEEEDAEITCYALQARNATGDAEAPRRAKELWLGAKANSDGCDDLINILAPAGLLSQEELWRKIRDLLDNNRLTAARRVNSYLPANATITEKQLQLAYNSPQRFLDKNNVRRPSTRELAILAMGRLARSDVLQAVEYFVAAGESFAPEDQAYVWARLGYRGALKHEPAALAWFKRAGNQALSAEHAAWKARAALRAESWQDVLDTIEAMVPAQANEPPWRYWKARALRSLLRTREANDLLLELSKEVHFYGLLAAEDIGPVVSAPREVWRASQAEVSAIEQERGIRRAMAMYRLGLNDEAMREWIYAVRSFDDKQLLSAAELAKRANWYDRMINTADKTKQLHDFSLRYPLPYREYLVAGAREHDVDEAWVFGLVRQESRFIAEARSSAGALGLMQLMPATARWVAQRLGASKPSTWQIRDVQTNAQFGTYYLRHVLDELGHPVLATAAYNAGPSRAKRWPDFKPMEGAIYAETIPITETRDYVKKVMANASIYAAQLGSKLVSLKQRLGTVPGKGQRIEEQQAVEEIVSQ